MDSSIETKRLIEARDKAAEIVVSDPSMAETFDYLDQAVRARESNDPVARARAIAAQKRKDQ